MVSDLLHALGMRTRTTNIRGIILLAALAGFSMACGPHYAEVAYVTTTNGQPPSPYDEEVGAAPGASYVWSPGYWWWDNTTYIWIRGSWILPPGPGYIWVRPGWVWSGGRYVFISGRWARRGQVQRHRYVHPHPRVHVRPGATYRRIQRTSPSRRRR